MSHLSLVRSSSTGLLATLMLLAPLSGCGTTQSAESTGETELAEPTSETPEAAKDALLSESLVKQFEQQVKGDAFPAIVVAVVDGDAAQVYTFGTLDSGAKPDGQTLFEIGSLTKTFTGLLLATDVLSNHVRLDQPVAKLLPDAKIPTRASKAITLEMLATHRSGLPRLPSNLDATASNPYASYDAEKLKSFLASYSLLRDPGASYEYSNAGYGLLGYALGQVSAKGEKKGYAGAVDAQIFKPLGMSSSLVNVSAAPPERLAKGHDGAHKPAANWDFSVLAPAGSIVSGGDDMLRYLKANMGRGDSALYPAMQLAHQARAAGAGDNERVGLAWMTHKSADKEIIWHNGMTAGYASFMGFLADGSRGVVVLTNISKPVDMLGFSTLLGREAPGAAQKAIEMSPDELDEYVGSYELAKGFVLSFYREGAQAFMQATGQGPLPIFASAKDEFFAKVAPISISFERDEAQQITTLILHQNGDHRAPRLSQEAVDALAAATTEVQLDPALLKDYVGRYQLTPQFEFTVTVKEGALFVQLSGQPANKVFASAEDHFFYKVVDAQIVFERDETGKVVALVLHQNGAEQRASIVAPE